MFLHLKVKGCVDVYLTIIDLADFFPSEYYYLNSVLGTVRPEKK